MSFYWSPAASDTSGELRGRPLRYLLVTLLADARSPLTVKELIAGCEAEGVVFEGRASKIISDALRWERRSGRVKHLKRGVYALGRVPRSTMRWIAHRVTQTRQWLRFTSDQPASRRAHTSEPILWWDWQGSSWVPGWPHWPMPSTE